jgi:EAL domain-containing protein (putative c-di-GMP-specific phosphodiesterase class I)
LEITVRVLLDAAESTVETLRELRALGLHLAIDDFGTGYSSLSYLKRFPVDVLKIDRSFVDGLGEDSEDQAIVTAVIGMAHALGLRVVAEGVEREIQLDELRRLRCDAVQGYLTGRPHPAADTLHLLRQEAASAGWSARPPCHGTAPEPASNAAFNPASIPAPARPAEPRPAPARA